MMWRLKRADFIDNIGSAVHHAYCSAQADAILHVDVKWRMRNARRIAEIFNSPAPFLVLQQPQHRVRLRQITGAHPVSRRSHVCRRDRVTRFRQAGGQSQFWARAGGPLSTPCDSWLVEVAWQRCWSQRCDLCPRPVGLGVKQCIV